MTTYKWSITAIDSYPQYQGKENVAFNVYWKLTDPTVVSPMIDIYAVYGSQALSYAAGSSFTDYADLKEDQVVQWVKEAIGATQVAALQSKLNINLGKAPSVAIQQQPLPWAK